MYKIPNILNAPMFCLILFTIISCSKKNPVIVEQEEIYRFPLKKSNFWRYIGVEKHWNSWNGTTTMNYDTLTLTVNDSGFDEWYQVLFMYSSPNKHDSAYVKMANTENGVYAIGYTALAGTIPIFKRSSNQSTDTTLLLPASISSNTWNQGDKICQNGEDTLIQWNDTVFNCNSIKSLKNNKILAWLYYCEIGFVSKIFAPDTVISGSDTIISTRSQYLNEYILF